MTHDNTGKGRIIFVEVPKDATVNYIQEISGTLKEFLQSIDAPEWQCPALSIQTFTGSGGTTSYNYLPEGSWQLLGRLNDITEEQAAQCVDRLKRFRKPIRFQDYGCPNCPYNEHWFSAAIESLQSLAQSLSVPSDAIILFEPKN